MAWGEVVSLALPPQVPVDMDQPTKHVTQPKWWSKINENCSSQYIIKSFHWFYLEFSFSFTYFSALRNLNGQLTFFLSQILLGILCLVEKNQSKMTSEVIIAEFFFDVSTWDAKTPVIWIHDMILLTSDSISYRLSSKKLEFFRKKFKA